MKIKREKERQRFVDEKGRKIRTKKEKECAREKKTFKK